MEDQKELKNLLLENLELAKENNHMLKRLRNGQRWATITKIIYWLFLIGLSVGAYYYLEPYVKTVRGIYDTNSSYFESMKGSFSDAKNFSDFLNQIKGKDNEPVQ